MDEKSTDRATLCTVSKKKEKPEIKAKKEGGRTDGMRKSFFL